MSFIEKAKKEIAGLIEQSIGRKTKIETSQLVTPPDKAMGDFAFGCFSLQKIFLKNPAEIAKIIAEKIGNNTKDGLIAEAFAVGPYVNFRLDTKRAATGILKDIEKEGGAYGRSEQGKKKKIMLEFAHPNTNKAFHIGHLRNVILGESMVRVMENAGSKVVRANYQGDIGMHVAKCLWGIEQLKDEYEGVKKENVVAKANFLGKAYALGGQIFEKDEAATEAMKAINKKIYENDPSIREVYKTTREWSLEYFDRIYKRAGTHFDRFYFESEVFEDGVNIVKKFLKKGVFEESQGAVIFPGEKYGLHSRVFINGKGLPTYEAKDLALAVKQFKEYKPDRIIHLVGKEQTEYFKVVFRALEFIVPKSKGKETHFDYGLVTLKSGKMSSRTGKVVLGEWLLDEVEKVIAERTKELSGKEKEEAVRKVALAAVKYAMLHTGVKNDIVFDLEASVSLTGSSGPYLLYIVTRVKSILEKFKGDMKKWSAPKMVERGERDLAFQLGKFPEASRTAFSELDPSHIAKYLFELAKTFNVFYETCPVLQAEEEVRNFRLHLIRATELVMTRGLSLLGIETVERM